ncbi:unnamed protein product [Cylicocyclus nassatus]|uniref:Uncharacterized protein n=1 Tax=Cylicocyclus nassatus TaxID=53992 RepID=A0AA36GGV0_CYLNA|nr:unnamed protein product [Cylicocyclus nassatus]
MSGGKVEKQPVLESVEQREEVQSEQDKLREPESQPKRSQVQEEKKDIIPTDEQNEKESQVKASEEGDMLEDREEVDDEVKKYCDLDPLRRPHLDINPHCPPQR